MPSPGSRTWYVLSVSERLGVEEITGEPSMDGLTWTMKAAATGDRDRFERCVTKLIPEPLRADVRRLAEQTVFEELRFRAILTTDPTPSKRPPAFDTWAPEIRYMLEKLLGARGGTGPVVRLEP